MNSDESTVWTRCELLAPAGEPEAGYAALHYGADAVYLGLQRFSARAEAVNFTEGQLADFAGYAHSLTPKRRVYLTLNTLVRQDEVEDAVRVLDAASRCGVDAVIVQDLGVARLVKNHFPHLRLHASTQLAIHNLDGVLAARDMGFHRVTLARELTFNEIANIVKAVDGTMEVETFIHGTLCYSYSGMCLFSSLAAGRSGNRGRCVYSCREPVVSDGDPCHPFSLKDMALNEEALRLAEAGVNSLKIEGRKKGPLYVAATVDHYRRILDGSLRGEAVRENAQRLRTIFARPWTDFFLNDIRNPEVADTEVVGHRGARIGEIDAVVSTPSGPGIRFTSSLAVERYDGIQIDLPGQPKPYGFPVHQLYRAGRTAMEPVFRIEAGEPAVVVLPPDQPALYPGLPVYLASSQEIKRSYPFTVPKTGASRSTAPVTVAVDIRTATGDPRASLVRCRVWLNSVVSDTLSDQTVNTPPTVIIDERYEQFAARDPAGAESVARTAFQRLGGTPFHLSGWRFANPDGLYLRPGEWNRLRRRVVELASAAVQQQAVRRHDEIMHDLSRSEHRGMPSGQHPGEPAWSLLVEDMDCLQLFGPGDFGERDELAVTLDPTRSGWMQTLEECRKRLGADRIRLAFPAIVREQGDGLRALVHRLHGEGWRRWLVSGLAGFRWLQGLDGVDMASDWLLYALNRQAIRFLAEHGVGQKILSPEDDRDNLAAIAGPDLQAPVYGSYPLFISAVCVHRQLGLCRSTKTDCLAGSCGILHALRLERGGPVEVQSSRSGSVTVGPVFSLLDRLPELQRMGFRCFTVDLRWRRRPAKEAAALWRRIRAGETLTGNAGNYQRGFR